MKTTIPQKFLFVLFILFSYTGWSWAQNIQVSGTVLEKNSDLGIPGVNIRIKSSNRGTVSDIDGTFSLEVAKGQNLVFSSIGLKNQEITIGTNNTFTILLHPVESATDEGCE